MDNIVYALCSVTGAVCAYCLFRGYWKQRTRLLLWSSLCFACLAASNILIYLDLVLLPGVDLGPLRNALTLLGVSMLIFGMISETV